MGLGAGLGSWETVGSCGGALYRAWDALSSLYSFFGWTQWRPTCIPSGCYQPMLPITFFLPWFILEQHMASMFLLYVLVPEISIYYCRNLVYFRRMVGLWLSLHFILRAVRISFSDKLDKAWGHWVGRWLRNGDITGTSRKKIWVVERATSNKIPSIDSIFLGKVQVGKAIPLQIPWRAEAF